MCFLISCLCYIPSRYLSEVHVIFDKIPKNSGALRAFRSWNRSNRFCHRNGFGSYRFCDRHPPKRLSVSFSGMVSVLFRSTGNFRSQFRLLPVWPPVSSKMVGKEEGRFLTWGFFPTSPPRLQTPLPLPLELYHHSSGLPPLELHQNTLDSWINSFGGSSPKGTPFSTSLWEILEFHPPRPPLVFLHHVFWYVLAFPPPSPCFASFLSPYMRTMRSRVRSLGFLPWEVLQFIHGLPICV